MSLQRLIPWLVVLLPVSVAGMAYGGHGHRLWLVIMAAALYSMTVIVAAISANAPYWTKTLQAGDPTGNPSSEAVAMLCRNIRLMAISYAWGGFAMQALYTTPLTGLKWQHGWQYAAIMALLSVGAFLFARLLEDQRPVMRRWLLAMAVPLAIGHALMAAGGLVFLAASGKLLLRKSDWAANQVFLFGALTIMILAAVTLRTHARLTRQQ